MGQIERVIGEHHLEERLKHYIETGVPESKLTIISNQDNRALLKNYPHVNDRVVASQSLETELLRLDNNKDLPLTSRDLYHYARALDNGEFLLYIDDIGTTKHSPDEEVIELKEERLAVNKEKVNKGEVVVQKHIEETIQEFDVPVDMENVTVERRPVEGEPLFEMYNSMEDSDDDLNVIRIPVTKERLRVIKEQVVTEEIVIRKEVVTKMEHVSGTVKNENIKVSEEKNEDLNKKEL